LITDCRFINDKGREKNGPKAVFINESIRGKNPRREEKRREEKEANELGIHHYYSYSG